jgi:Zn-finger nucleic acid-binding protein
MKQRTIDEITIDECIHCGGMWFDRGDLDEVKDKVLPDMGWLEIDAWKEKAQFKVGKDSNYCPKCRNIALTSIQDEESATALSICAQCRGTWLAAGQFLQLINALIDEANRTSAPEFVKITLQQAKDMVTSSDSFVSEWQDLKTLLTLLKDRIFIEHPKLRSLLLGLQKSLPL